MARHLWQVALVAGTAGLISRSLEADSAASVLLSLAGLSSCLPCFAAPAISTPRPNAFLGLTRTPLGAGSGGARAAALDDVGRRALSVIGFAESVGLDAERCLNIFLLLVLQLRFFPWLWKSLTMRCLKVTDPQEFMDLQDRRLNGSKLRKDLTISGKTLVSGSRILADFETLSAARLPFRLWYRPASVWMKAGSTERGWRSTVANTLGAVARAEGPMRFWAWSQLIARGLTWAVLKGGVVFFSKAGVARVQVASLGFGNAINLTALALFCHSLSSWWQSLYSRGRAEENDVLGSQSSLREAQINALKVLMQVIVWTFYLVGVFWSMGINPGRVLLFPSIGAVVLGWVGREILANLMAGVMINLTQPFAQGDWVALENGTIDGWVQDIGVFYTRVVQWDKRPIYVPNYKIMTMNVQNNSRMTHRRILFDLPLRIRDIPKLPQIVQEIQDMVNHHEDVDSVQHRLVRWREIGAFSANIWVSCYTRPTLDGIRLGPWTAAQQSILERCTGIIYKNEAQFACSTDRFTNAVEKDKSSEGLPGMGKFLSDSFFRSNDTSHKALDQRESQQDGREQALRLKENALKERERELEAVEAAQAKKEKAIAQASEKYKQVLQNAAMAVLPIDSKDAAKEATNSGNESRDIDGEGDAASETKGEGCVESSAAAAAASEASDADGTTTVSAAAAPAEGGSGRRQGGAESSGKEEKKGKASVKVPAGEREPTATQLRDTGAADKDAAARLEEVAEDLMAAQQREGGASSVDLDPSEKSLASATVAEGAESELDRSREHVGIGFVADKGEEDKDIGDGSSYDDDENSPVHESQTVHSGKVLHVKKAESTRIPVKEMGD